jgi:type IV pilus assembly protein PilB
MSVPAKTDIQLKEGFLEEQLSQRYGITPEQMGQARKLNTKNHQGILINLQQMGALNEQKVVQIQEECFGTHAIHIKNHPLKPEIVALLPEEIRAQFQILPISLTGNILTVATGSLFQAQSASPAIQKHTQHFISFSLTYPTELHQRLQEFSKTKENIDELLEDRAKELSDGTDLTDQKLIEDPHGPIAQVINYLVNTAVTIGASDMHFEPLSGSYRVRFRQDGLLREIKSFEKVFTSPFSAAIKIMAAMDIAETRMPQDGTFRAQISGRTVDFRVATYPTEFGEKIVIRILDSNKGGIILDSLLLPEAEKQKLITMIENPYGLIVCAGPTGSGKSTTLYAMLGHLNHPKRNILTIEDPIEYRMPGISQAQVNVKKGFTFASGLRAMLRLDPNVILVGEMRDLETASIGVQAALTGHLVLSTVHANSATQTVARFMDLGVESFTVASALQGVISQRLIRRLCEACKVSYAPTEQELKDSGFKPPYPKNLFMGKGCKECHQDGYRGRLPIMEILVIYDDMRNLIKEGAGPTEIFKSAMQHGMMTIRDNAIQKTLQGLTTTQEMMRVLGPAGDDELAKQVVPLKPKKAAQG